MHPSVKNVLATAGVLAAIALILPTSALAGPGESTRTPDIVFDFFTFDLYARMDGTSWAQMRPPGAFSFECSGGIRIRA